jgi:hypothetical protein
MEKIIKNSIIAILSCCFCVGCGSNSRNKSNNKEGHISLSTYAVIEKNIKKLELSSWNKEAYLEIKEKQLPLLKLPSEKRALSGLLNTIYSNILVRDASKILGGACSKQHSQLDLIMKELKNFPDATGLTTLIAQKDQHDEMERFVRQLASASQKVNSFLDEYDTSYDRRQRVQAQSYLSQKPTCDYLKTNLANPNSHLIIRQKKFCEAIIALYLQKEEYVESDRNRVVAHLAFFPDEEAKSQWLSEIEEFDQKKQQEIEENNKME